MKRICCYLQGTKTKVMILCPLKQSIIDCLVDADFAGQWNVENPQDPLCEVMYWIHFDRWKLSSSLGVQTTI